MEEGIAVGGEQFHHCSDPTLGPGDFDSQFYVKTDLDVPDHGTGDSERGLE